MKKGKCAKTIVRCTIVTWDNKHFVGENWCETPQEICPRTEGEGYEKCQTICNQIGHAEIVALKIAGAKALNARAYIEGHTYVCKDCQHALFGAGIKSITVGRPSDFYVEDMGLR